MRIGLRVALVVAAMSGLAFANGAQALPIDNSNVSGNYGTQTAISTDTDQLSTSKIITFGGAQISNTGLPPFYTPLGGSSAANTFLTSANTLTLGGSVGSVVSLNLTGIGTQLVTVNIPDFMVFTGSTGNYDFNVTGISIVNQVSGFLSIDVVGTLVDQSGNFMDTNAAASLTFTQSGDSGTIAGGFTLGSPPNFVPPPSVPEPMSLAIMGVGLIGLHVGRRRKSA